MSNWGFDKVKQNIALTKRVLPVKLAKQAENHFTESFTKGRLDEYKWKEVQRRIAGTKAYKYPKKKGLSRRTSPILVRTGNLRRKVARSIQDARWDKVRLIVDLPYAEIHNEGGEISMKERESVVHFRAKTYGLDATLKQSVFSSKKGATHSRKVKIGAHKIVFPARPYMKQTTTLANMQLKLIETETDKIWK